MRVHGRWACAAIAVALFGLAAPAPARGDNATEAAPEAAASRTPDQPTGKLPGRPIAPAAIDAARQAVLDADYQAELPRYAQSGSASGLPRRRAGGVLDDVDRDRRALDDTRAQPGPGTGSSLMRFILWGLVVVASVLIASWLASELSRFGGSAEFVPEDVRDRMQAASAAIIERPLGDADELAARGEFAEAIHTLLLRTLQELARTAAVRVGPATTSREILARVPLLADARSALAGLITAVEITHFGDEPANAGDYDRCRQQFHVFAQAFRGGAPRPGVQAA